MQLFTTMEEALTTDHRPSVIK